MKLSWFSSVFTLCIVLGLITSSVLSGPVRRQTDLRDVPYWWGPKSNCKDRLPTGNAVTPSPTPTRAPTAVNSVAPTTPGTPTARPSPTSKPSPTSTPVPSEPPRQAFITRRGSTLYEGSQPFRFISVNVPSLLINGDKPDNGWVYPEPYEQDDQMRSVAGLGGRVARTYTLSVKYHITGANSYSERGFVALDNAIAAASRHGVRLIIPFINHDITAYGTGGDAYFYGSYAAFANLRGSRRAEAFFTDSVVIEDFKKFISYVLNRRNTVTGVRYGDDPTILAWQTGNELGGWEGAPAPAEWLSTIAAHIKSHAKQLVMDGTIGGTQRWRGLRDPNIDIFTNHYYGVNDKDPMRRHAQVAADSGKAFIAGEYGLTNPSTYVAIMDETLNNPNIAGSMIWSLRGHSINGGFFVHGEGKLDTTGAYDIVSYHVPGFPANTADKFGPEEATVIPALRQRALAIQGLPADTPHPTPIPPVLLSARNGQLRWRGSAWAAYYNIYRSSRRDGIESAEPLAAGVLDRFSAHRVLKEAMYTDGTGSQARYWYMIRAIGVEGQQSAPSNVIASRD
ncbi:glycoside hydrolase superfamily [Gaertneriomyces semiglobifer]|nr:glycoside hydrolase superfamily [Gaertneriomyces semiglobifer]